jgi:hypothetical protein
VSVFPGVKLASQRVSTFWRKPWRRYLDLAGEEGDLRSNPFGFDDDQKQHFAEDRCGQRW